MHTLHAQASQNVRHDETEVNEQPGDDVTGTNPATKTGFSEIK